MYVDAPGLGSISSNSCPKRLLVPHLCRHQKALHLIILSSANVSHAGPSDFTACKRPCAAAAWQVHDGGTALHGGLPPGYQTWVLSARATASSFAGRGSPAAPEAVHVDLPEAAGPSAQPAAGAEHGAAQRLPKAAPVPGSDVWRTEPSSAEAAAAAATAAYKLLQDDPGSTEGEQDAGQTSSLEEASSGGSECGGSTRGLSEDSTGALWDYPEADPNMAVTGAEAPMGLGAFPSPRPRRWVSVAPSAWGPTKLAAGVSLHSLPHLDDSLLLAGAGQLPAPVHHVSAAQPPRSLPSAVPAAPSGRSGTVARAQAKEAVTASSRLELRLRGGRQSQELSKEQVKASCSGAVGTSGRDWLRYEEEPGFSCWRGVGAAVSARLNRRGGRLLSLDLPDGTVVLQDARLQFT